MHARRSELTRTPKNVESPHRWLNLALDRAGWWEAYPACAKSAVLLDEGHPDLARRYFELAVAAEPKHECVQALRPS